jgi:hypothetical protein
VLARNFLFALFISVIPALMPVVGLKVLQLSSSSLGLLFTSMGAGSVVAAVFILPWLRVHLSPDRLTLSANLLLVLVYVLMAFVHPKGNRRNLLNHRCASQGMPVRPAVVLTLSYFTPGDTNVFTGPIMVKKA